MIVVAGAGFPGGAGPSAVPLEQVPRVISREQMADLPIRRYEGEVCLVAAAQDFERAVADIRQEGAVGFDTETRPAFRKGEVYLPCLAQAATARAVYLFQLRRPDAFEALSGMLQESRITKAGVGLADDMRSLKLVFPFDERSTVDLGVVARRAGFHQSGLRNLAGMFLGFRVPKGARTSNWAARELSSAQITYAATDAWVCRELYLRFAGLGLAGVAV